MVANRNSVKLHLVVFAATHADQRKVGCATADVANKDLLPRFNSLVPIIRMRINPRIERCLRFFDQDDSRQTSPGCGLDRQFASDFVKRSRKR